MLPCVVARAQHEVATISASSRILSISQSQNMSVRHVVLPPNSYKCFLARDRVENTRPLQIVIYAPEELRLLVLPLASETRCVLTNTHDTN